MPLHPFTTQIVGSYVKPQWLARHGRMRALDGSFWRPEPEVLQEAREDAALLSLYEQERAGLDVVNDGEAQRAAYDRHFLAGLTGIDLGLTQRVPFRGEVETARRDETAVAEHVRTSETKPTVTGAVAWERPVALDELRFLKRHSTKPVKANVIGPMSLYFQVVDRYYNDEETAIMAFAAALNRELLALDREGVALIQIDEPMLHFKLSLAERIGKAALTRMVEGIATPVVVHVCYGYAMINREKSASPTYPRVLELLADCPVSGISLEYSQPGHDPALLTSCGDKHVLLGLLNLGTRQIEAPEEIADKIRAALTVVPPERLHPCSDCGMWYLPRDVAYRKIKSLVAGTDIVRRELGLRVGP